jgi:hypothetical protein
MGRPYLPKDRKLTFHLASTLTAEDRQLFEHLAAMINKPLGALAREAIGVMLEKEKSSQSRMAEGASRSC